MNDANTDHLASIAAELRRIADSLEGRLAVTHFSPPDDVDAFVWQTQPPGLRGVEVVNRVDLALLRAVDLQRRLLLDNTRRFAAGLPANNALLWGARGMGKSSLVKAVHAAVSSSDTQYNLRLVEIHREDIETLPDLMAVLQNSPGRFIVFCDDLSFSHDDTSYKSLKAVLEGGIEGRPANMIFYATSNRRHLLPRDMMENESSTAINPAETVEEKVSLSDRFGLWIGFHNCSQDDYIAMVAGYVAHFRIQVDETEWRSQALEWSRTRGARSGRVAWQFVQDLAGRTAL